MVISTQETDATWMYTQNWRQSGNAVDSNGNKWAFRGHWSATEHGDPNADLYTTDFHSMSKDTLIADPGNSKGAGNLLMSASRRIKIENGEWIVNVRDVSVTCLP